MNQRKQEIVYIAFDLLIATIPFFYITLLYRAGSTDLNNLKEVVFANSLLYTLFYISNIVLYFKIEFDIGFAPTVKIIIITLAFFGIVLVILYPLFGWAIALFVLLDSFVTFLRGDKLREKKYIEASLINFFLHSGKLLAFILLFSFSILTRWIISNIIGYLIVLVINILSLRKYLWSNSINNSSHLDFAKIKERIYYFVFVMLIFIFQNIEMLTLKGLSFYNMLVLIKPWGSVIFVITISIGNLVLVNKRIYPYFVYLILALIGMFSVYLSFGKHINYYIFHISLLQQPSTLSVVFYFFMAIILFGNYLSYINKKYPIVEPLILFLILGILKSKISFIKHMNLVEFLLSIGISIVIHLIVLLLSFSIKNSKIKYEMTN